MPDSGALRVLTEPSGESLFTAETLLPAPNFPVVISGGPLEGQRALIKLHATPKELNLKMIRDDGELVGKYTIGRKSRT